MEETKTTMQTEHQTVYEAVRFVPYPEFNPMQMI